MKKLLTAALLALLLVPTISEATAPTYTTDVRIIYSGDTWTQLEDDNHCVMMLTKKLKKTGGQLEPGTMYRILWNTHHNDSEADDTIIHVEAL